LLGQVAASNQATIERAAHLVDRARPAAGCLARAHVQAGHRRPACIALLELARRLLAARIDLRIFDAALVPDLTTGRDPVAIIEREAPDLAGVLVASAREALAGSGCWSFPIAARCRRHSARPADRSGGHRSRRQLGSCQASRRFVPRLHLMQAERFQCPDDRSHASSHADPGGAVVQANRCAGLDPTLPRQRAAMDATARVRLRVLWRRIL